MNRRTRLILALILGIGIGLMVKNNFIIIKTLCWFCFPKFFFKIRGRFIYWFKKLKFIKNYL